MDKIFGLAIGLHIFNANGYTDVVANDGVVYCGAGEIDSGETKLLVDLGWDWDEDNGEWYLLVDRDKEINRPESRYKEALEDIYAYVQCEETQGDKVVSRIARKALGYKE